MDCGCLLCKMNHPIVATKLPEDPAPSTVSQSDSLLEEKIDFISRRIATCCFTGASVSYSIFRNTLQNRLRHNPQRLIQLYAAFLQDFLNHQLSKVPERLPLEPRIDAVMSVVSRSLPLLEELRKCMWKDDVNGRIPSVLTRGHGGVQSASTYPKINVKRVGASISHAIFRAPPPSFLPLFETLLRDDLELLNGLWVGIYCGVVNTIALSILNGTTPSGPLERLLSRKIGQKEGMRGSRERLVTLIQDHLQGKEMMNGEEVEIALCNGVIAWINEFGEQLGLEALKDYIAEVLYIPPEAAVLESTWVAKKKEEFHGMPL